MEEKKGIFVFKKQPPLNQPYAFLKEMGPELGFETEPEKLRANHKALSLAGLVLITELDSETPFHKFLEGQPCRINIDKLERKKYVLSGSVEAFREVYLEHKEQKVAKALLLFLCQHFPELFEDLWPKHGLVPPVGISLRRLSEEELAGFDLSIRLRHVYLLSSFNLSPAEALELFALDARPQIWHKTDESVKGFLFEPLLQYMALITRGLNEEHPLREYVRPLLDTLKKLYPEPFALIPEA